MFCILIPTLKPIFLQLAGVSKYLGSLLRRVCWLSSTKIAILIYGWGARASRKTPACLLSTMSRMTKNAQKIYSRNPVLLSDLLGNFGTSKSQFSVFCHFAWGHSRTGGRSEGEGGDQRYSFIDYLESPRAPRGVKICAIIHQTWIWKFGALIFSQNWRNFKKNSRCHQI